MKINPTKTVNELIVTVSCITDIEKNRKIYHAWKVGILSAAFARNLVPAKNLQEIFYAALLHDIGGAGFPFHIIHYLKRSDKMSRDILLSHPIIGAHMVSDIPRMQEVAKLILSHHEWINGEGYPGAKTQKDIPFGAQVIRLADALDILLHSRHYRGLKELQKELSLNINKEYAKELFHYACKALKKEGVFPRISQGREIPGLLEETNAGVGLIHIPSKLDAIGKTLGVVAQIIDMRHPYASGHSARVSRYAMAIALALNLPHDEVTRIRWAGLIHDVGKIHISRQIMNKPTKLSAQEFREIKKHASFTHKIVEMLPSLKDISLIASSHHEFYDGSGYPQGLKGEQIPLAARILVVCDAFDAMTSNRPYRNPLTAQAACRQIKDLSGKQFDAAIAKKAIPLFMSLSL